MMSTTTTNYALEKPGDNDTADISVVNNNMDIIDTKIKEAMDTADSAFQSASNGKTDIATVVGSPVTSGDTFSQIKTKIQTIKDTMATNLTVKGVSALASETMSALAGKIANIIRGSGNATAADVRKDKTFSNDSGPGQTGTMPENGPTVAETINLTSQNQEYIISAGYHSGLRKIKAVIAGLAASMIRAGSTVGGIAGTFTADATATAAHILSGKTAGINGAMTPGTMANNGATGATLTQQGQTYNIPAGYTSGGSVQADISNLIASVIKQYENVGGVIGTLRPWVNEKQWASGTATSNPSGAAAFQVTGLSFKPSLIIAHVPGQPSDNALTVYCPALLSNGMYVNFSADGDVFTVDASDTGTNFYVSTGSFRLKSISYNQTYQWIAIE